MENCRPSAAELHDAEEQEAAQYAAMKERIRFMYESGDAVYLEKIEVESGNPFYYAENGTLWNKEYTLVRQPQAAAIDAVSFANAKKIGVGALYNCHITNSDNGNTENVSEICDYAFMNSNTGDGLFLGCTEEKGCGSIKFGKFVFAGVNGL